MERKGEVISERDEQIYLTLFFGNFSSLMIEIIIISPYEDHGKPSKIYSLPLFPSPFFSSMGRRVYTRMVPPFFLKKK